MHGFEPLQAYRSIRIDGGGSFEPAHDGGPMFTAASGQFTNRPAEGDENGSQASGRHGRHVTILVTSGIRVTKMVTNELLFREGRRARCSVDRRFCKDHPWSVGKGGGT